MTSAPGGTATEHLPFTDGRLLIVVTDLASGGRHAAIDGVPVDEARLDDAVSQWRQEHPPHQPPSSPQADPVAARKRNERVARVRALAFRGARPRG